MSAGFGFSVGDFVTGINLLKNVIDALKDCGESTAEYRGLTKDLENLMTTLCQVQHLEFDESLLSERDALYKAASYVQGIIEQFLDKNQKFHDPLSIGGSGSRVRDAWKKVQWALCKKEDVAKFREQLRDCIGTINLLLATAQMKVTVLQKGEQQQQQQQRSSVAAILHEHYLCYLDQYQTLKRGMIELMDMARSILILNKQIIQLMGENDPNTVELPPQVKFQPPVTLLDAFGIRAPFYLETMSSAPYLFDFLQRRFENAGAEKIANGEFILEEMNTSRRIDLEQEWQTCFVPGETVRMTFIFFGKQSQGYQTRPNKTRPPPPTSSSRIEEIGDTPPSGESSTPDLSPVPFEAIPPARRLKRKFNMAFDDRLPKRHALGSLRPKSDFIQKEPHAEDRKLYAELYRTLEMFHKYSEESVAGHIMVKYRD